MDFRKFLPLCAAVGSLIGTLGASSGNGPVAAATISHRVSKPGQVLELLITVRKAVAPFSAMPEYPEGLKLRGFRKPQHLTEGGRMSGCFASVSSPKPWVIMKSPYPRLDRDGICRHQAGHSACFQQREAALARCTRTRPDHRYSDGACAGGGQNIPHTRPHAIAQSDSSGWQAASRESPLLDRARVSWLCNYPGK